MAASSQQPLSAMFYGGSQQPSTVIQTVAQTTTSAPVERGDKLLHSKSHCILGVMQMVVGCLCFLLSILGFIVGTDILIYVYFGAGIYSGIFFVIPGFLGFMAYKHNSQGCVIGCMVMNIIGTFVAIIGITCATLELILNSKSLNVNSKLTFQTAKNAIVITACFFEFFVTIVHAGFTCASYCDCCLPRRIASEASPVTGPMFVQVPQSNVTYHGQVWVPYHGSTLQHQFIQQPAYGREWPSQSQQMVQNYPQQSFQNNRQQFDQGAIPQQPLNPPAINTGVLDSSLPGYKPPHFSE